MPGQRRTKRGGVFSGAYNYNKPGHVLARASSVLKHMKTGSDGCSSKGVRIDPKSEEGKRIQREMAEKYPELGIKAPSV